MKICKNSVNDWKTLHVESIKVLRSLLPSTIINIIFLNTDLKFQERPSARSFIDQIQLETRFTHILVISILFSYTIIKREFYKK